MAAEVGRRCVQCDGLLSRYNDADRCAACTRLEAALVPELPRVPSRVWRDPAVQGALADWDFGLASRLIRQRSSLRQEDLAGLTGLSQAFLSMLESGSRRLTNIDKITAFLGGLEVPSHLVQVPIPGRPSRAVPLPPRPQSEDQDPALSWTAGRMVATLNDAVGGRSVERRSFLAVSGMALTAYVHHWSTADAEPLERAVDGSSVSAALVLHLQGTIDHLRTMDASAGSGSLAQLGSAHLALLSTTLKHGTYGEAIGRQLAGIAADTAAQTGWFYFDSGQHDLAQQYLLASLRAAHASGDPRLGAAALSYLAIHSYSTGHPRDAVSAAQAAREKTKSLGTTALHAMLLTRQARGHAKLGEEQAAWRALEQAAELCAKGRSEQDPHWLYWINEGEIHGQAGSCHLDLDNPIKAMESLGAAQAALNPADRRTRALFLTRAATAQVRIGDIEAACATAHEAISHAEHLQSARLKDHLTSLTTELRTAGPNAYAHDVIERAATVSRTET
ncbi:helix-turn-helix transcriptional regulator [Streptomyces sp. So13.3]|uniref:helix-turn-helix domain-containing protein n=1 Tax=Streptomyces sp. So13.3 TaxID=2136173 RepID=UPI00110659D3|nr:helix-turn-helix transcriptional regulator [Streptomyces sp. So13.3]QNA72047.1 helix-turn-helix transcriptional regulator [Streptomyces sp. So13.3]